MITTDVLIVGAGPVGILTALLLDKVGLDCRVVEQRSGLHTAPQAHVISSRSLEICRAIGISDLAIREAGPAPADTMYIRWVDRLAGRDLGVFSLARDRQALEHMLSTTPTPTTNLSQDQFERLLFEHLPDPSKVLFGHTWQGFETEQTGYVSTLSVGTGQPLTIASRYLIGADGAGSAVRKALGATMIGPDNIQTFVNIHFNANLRKPLEGREALLYWVMDKACEGTFIAHDIDRNWVFMKSIDADEAVERINEAKLTETLRKAIGVDVELTVNSMNVWRMTAQISDTYQSGQVFLVGDAAHRFPPTGGIGMNTGFQDAHNLVWKIAMVEHGFDPALLETYAAERKPVAEANSAQSLTNAMSMSEVAKLLDVDGDKRISMADLEQVLADADLMADVQAAVERQSAHFNMSGLDLGFCYASAAVRRDGAPPRSAEPVSYYLPSTTPGARMPHAWLQSAAARTSTLDLIQYGRLLVLSPADAMEIAGAVRQLAAAGYPLDLATVGGHGEWQAADETFAQLFGSDVLLVRPDGHIAARFPAATAANELGATLLTLFPLGQLML